MPFSYSIIPKPFLLWSMYLIFKIVLKLVVMYINQSNYLLFFVLFSYQICIEVIGSLSSTRHAVPSTRDRHPLALLGDPEINSG